MSGDFAKSRPRHLQSTPGLQSTLGYASGVLCKSSVYFSSKHLDVRYFKTRDYIEAGILSFTYVDTSDNIADFFTKSLARPAFSRFRRFLMNLPSGFQ